MSVAEIKRRKIANRLKRARGQLDAIINAVENDAPCREVVTQLSAVIHALNRAGFTVVASAMEECARSAEVSEKSAELTTEELEKLFLTLA